MEGYHKTVLLKESINSLDVQKGEWYIDGTLGDGGHSVEILKGGGRVVGIDVDPHALERTKERLSNLGVGSNNYKLILGNFKDLIQLIEENGLRDMVFTGILLDLGVSSLQLEESTRGFSFNSNATLDMRMNLRLSVTAADLIKVLNKGELSDLFTKLADEKLAGRIAEALVSTRQVNDIKTTHELAEIVKLVYKKAGVKSKIHPATKVFQALRIAVNDELNNLRSVLPQSLNLLGNGGRLAVISFHSLEDREVKNTFRTWRLANYGFELTKKPIEPTREEISINQRSRSAKLRVFIKS